MATLVACEESQEVTKALRRHGVEAYSCDLEECSGGHPEWHLKEDVTGLLKNSWDAVIAFPPCTHLTSAGSKHFKTKQEDGRQQQAVSFFLQFTTLDHVPYVAIENPVGIMSSIYRKPDQYIQPYEYGHKVTKKTCLWLKGLPLLTPTNIVDKGETITFPSGKKMSKWYYETSCLPVRLRSIARSKTFYGIADAIAVQWSEKLR